MINGFYGNYLQRTNIGNCSVLRLPAKCILVLLPVSKTWYWETRLKNLHVYVDNRGEAYGVEDQTITWFRAKKKKVTDNNYLKKSIQFHLQVKTASRVNIVSALKRVKTAELKGDKQDSENQTVIKSTARYYYLHLFS